MQKVKMNDSVTDSSSLIDKFVDFIPSIGFKGISMVAKTNLMRVTPV